MTRKLTLDEVAALLRVSPKTVYGWTSSRRIPHLKLGGRLRFDEAEIAEWAEGFRVETEGPNPPTRMTRKGLDSHVVKRWTGRPMRVKPER